MKLYDAAVGRNRNEFNELPAGLRSLPPDLTPAELASAPILHSVDDLLIEGASRIDYFAIRFLPPNTVDASASPADLASNG